MIKISSVQEQFLLAGKTISIIMSPAPLVGSAVILESVNNRFVGYVDSIETNSIGLQCNIVL